jgi:hypothetical protein
MGYAVWFAASVSSECQGQGLAQARDGVGCVCSRYSPMCVGRSAVSAGAFWGSSREWAPGSMSCPGVGCSLRIEAQGDLEDPQLTW